MKLDIGGAETFPVPIEALWAAVNDPAVLKKCIPGCREMIAKEDEDCFALLLSLRVASVGGDFDGAVSLSDKIAPTQCRISVSGSGTLGHGEGSATFSLAPQTDQVTIMRYSGEGEIGGLVAGVGQRILKGVAKHLVAQFFTALRREIDEKSRA